MDPNRYPPDNAPEIQLEPFAVRAESEGDTLLASDLRFTSTIAEHLQAIGKLALVVAATREMRLLPS
ncbi:MAG TPA: hypothetical protein VK712_03040 [Verrucomicrobiae bacterium]|nr:hypothetical protein [Verrucomicrobiae bacterium]